MSALEKPTYSTSKRALWSAFGFAALCILPLVGGALTGNALAVEMAKVIAVPVLMLPAAVLGIHRGFGSMDMRARGRAAPRRQKPSEEQPA